MPPSHMHPSKIDPLNRNGKKIFYFLGGTGGQKLSSPQIKMLAIITKKSYPLTMYYLNMYYLDDDDINDFRRCLRESIIEIPPSDDTYDDMPELEKLPKLIPQRPILN
jgi:hypothetical protein